MGDLATVFEDFCKCSCLRTLLEHHSKLCDLIGVKPDRINEFYPKFKEKFVEWKWSSFWAAFDKKASNPVYEGGEACSKTRVLVVGAGPVGLRTAIEAQFLGAKVVVAEKREIVSRHNVLHLWQFVIDDLKALNAKKFYAKFCAGGIEHISIRRLQFMLLKVALILGVEVHAGVGFEGLQFPSENGSAGWRAKMSPGEHVLSNYEFDVLIGANGKHRTLEGFKKKSFRGKLAIAITANFVNRHSAAENEVPEIAGVASIYKKQFFDDLQVATGARLENIVYYKDETHYFVMTVHKDSLLEKGVLITDKSDPVELLSLRNRSKEKLEQFTMDVCKHSTENKIPDMEFVVKNNGEKDVSMFDFTHMFSAEHASRVDERNGRRLLQMLVGDSLLEPFWPTGSGCARGFLGALDSAWAIKKWKNCEADPLIVIAERESIFRALPQAENHNLNKNYAGYTIDPATRYPFLDPTKVRPENVKALYVATGGPVISPILKEPSTVLPPSEGGDVLWRDWVLLDKTLVDEEDDGMAQAMDDMEEAVMGHMFDMEDDYKNFDISLAQDYTLDSTVADDCDYAMPALGDDDAQTIGGVLRELGLDPNTKISKGRGDPVFYHLGIELKCATLLH